MEHAKEYNAENCGETEKSIPELDAGDDTPVDFFEFTSEEAEDFLDDASILYPEEIKK